MLRRTFLQVVGLAGLSSLLPNRAGARQERKLILVDVFVAGFQYHEGMRREVVNREAPTWERVMIRMYQVV